MRRVLPTPDGPSSATTCPVTSAGAHAILDLQRDALEDLVAAQLLPDVADVEQHVRAGRRRCRRLPATDRKGEGGEGGVGGGRSAGRHRATRSRLTYGQRTRTTTPIR